MTIDAYEAHTETLPAQSHRPGTRRHHGRAATASPSSASSSPRLPEIDVRGWCEDIGEAAGLLAAAPAAVLHATADWHAVYGELAAIREHTAAPIVLIAPEGSPEPPSFGASSVELLVLPQPAEAVVAAVRRAQGDRQSPRAGDHARVLTVFSPKGGTGKSVIAANLAVALAAGGVRTLLLDLQLERGDAALMLGLDPERTIYDLVAAPGELDALKLTGYTTEHSSGLHVLPAPLRPEQAELLGEADITRVLELAREAYAAVVVDSPASFHGALLAALDASDALVLVAELDTATLKNVGVALETLELLRFPPDKVALLLNQTGPATSLKRSELEAALGTRVRFEVPYDADVPAAVGRGAPRVLGAQRLLACRGQGGLGARTAAGACRTRQADAPQRPTETAAGGAAGSASGGGNHGTPAATAAGRRSPPRTAATGTATV